MVELARLERVYGRKVIQGSNPCLSAIENLPDFRFGRFSIDERLDSLFDFFPDEVGAFIFLYFNITFRPELLIAQSGLKPMANILRLQAWVAR